VNAIYEDDLKSEPPAELAVWIESLIDGDIAPDQYELLGQALKECPEARQQFLNEMQVHAALKWDGLDGFDPNDEFHAAHACVAPRFPLIAASIHNALGFFSQEMPFAMLVATVITSLGLLAGSMVYVSQPQPIAKITSPAAPALGQSGSPREQQYIGRISGMIDCKGCLKGLGNRDWGLETARNNKAFIALGDEFILSSGLLEIIYDTGAKVILQGPVTYKVDSRDSGFLSIGKLTARLDKKRSEVRDQGAGKVVSGQWSVASETNPEIPKSQIPNPSSSPDPRPQSPTPTFLVRTPTATVTDLGTEFGVNVAKDHTADVCVFEGTVEVVRTSSALGERTVKHRLAAGDAIRLNATAGVQSLSANSFQASFVRNLPAPRVLSGLKRGLVAYWSFDDADNLGKNATGGGDLLPENSPESESKGLIGGALRLHGPRSRDMLVYHAGHGVPAGVPIGNTSYSISAWLSISNRGPDNNGILGWGEPSLNRANVLVVKPLEEDFLVGNYWWDYDLYQKVEEQRIQGGWHHLVATYDRRTKLQRLFLDGKWLASRGVTEERDLGANNFAVGRGYLDPNNQAEFFDGCLDEIGIWDRELSEAEIERLYNQGKGLNPLAR